MKNEEMIAVVEKMRIDVDRLYKDLKSADQEKEARRSIVYLGRLIGELKK